MRGQANITTQGGTSTFDVPEGGGLGVLALYTDSGNGAAVVFAVDVEVFPGQFIQNVALSDALATTPTFSATITGPSKYYTITNHGFYSIRVRRTDANGGAGIIGVSMREGC